MQLAAADAARLAPSIEQFAVVVAYVTAPAGDPPEAVRTIGVPTAPEVTAFDTRRAGWAAAANAKATGALALAA